MELPAGAEPALGDFLSVLKRRGRLLWTVIGVVVLIGVLAAYRVPPVYGSSGILVADQPDVPETVVRSTVPTEPNDLVRIITQRVVTNENLKKIVAEEQLYPQLRDQPDVALDQFRQHLALAAEDPDILENLLGPSRAAQAMAFSITFSDPSPMVARNVARRLVSLYLEDNQRARSEQAEATTKFLGTEVARLEVEIEAREKRLAAFKREHLGSLPDDKDREAEDRVQRELASVEGEIRSLRDRRDLAASALTQIPPNATVVDENGQQVLGPDERRTVLERRYAQLRAVYSEDHPDVQKALRELRSLGGGTGVPAADRQDLKSELAAREDELAAAHTRYSPDHPDVQRLERAVAGLRAALAQPPARSSSRVVPDNPQYIERQAQLKSVGSDLDTALSRRRELTAQLAELQRHAANAPDVESELSALNRGYEQLLAQYGDTQAKLHEAQMAANLESEGRGDRFTVLQSPQIPTSPMQPNRMAVLLLTLFAAFTLGTGAVAVAERCDTTVRHPRDVSEHFGAPPIVAIPFVCNAADERRLARRRFATITLSCLWVGAIVFLVMTPA